MLTAVVAHPPLFGATVMEAVFDQVVKHTPAELSQVLGRADDSHGTIVVRFGRLGRLGRVKGLA
jgi:hypothetical protein